MKKVKTFIFNIGLSDPELSYEYVLKCLFANDFHIMSFSIEEGVYNGKIEKTLVAQIRIDTPLQDIFDITTGLCEYLMQDCIALFFPHDPELSHLIYNPYYGGEQQLFNEEFFLKGYILPQTELYDYQRDAELLSKLNSNK